ncbi:hypothetical protein ACIP80_36000 [Streptomyces sp. NPDC088555]|uniref:hypothetical protein n=1 Tax=Streptomyces sp. NPDC088555 TaxID=3365866 RepID=UPI00380502DF
MNQWARLDERGGVPEGARPEGTVRTEDAVHKDLYDKDEHATPASRGWTTSSPPTWRREPTNGKIIHK